MSVETREYWIGANTTDIMYVTSAAQINNNLYFHLWLQSQMEVNTLLLLAMQESVSIHVRIYIRYCKSRVLRLNVIEIEGLYENI